MDETCGKLRVVLFELLLGVLTLCSGWLYRPGLWTIISFPATFDGSFRFRVSTMSTEKVVK